MAVRGRQTAEITAISDGNAEIDDLPSHAVDQYGPFLLSCFAHDFVPRMPCITGEKAPPGEDRVSENLSDKVEEIIPFFFAGMHQNSVFCHFCSF